MKLKTSLTKIPRVSIYGVLFLLALFTTYLAWKLPNDSNKSASKRNLEVAVEGANDEINKEINSYINLLYAAKAFYDSSDEINVEEWQNYVSELETEKNFPGMSSLGVAYEVNSEPGDLKIFEDSLKNDYEDYEFQINSINASDLPERENYYILRHISPLTDGRERAIAANIESDKNRSDAIESAINSNSPSATAPIIYSTVNQPGVTLYVPSNKLTENGNPEAVIVLGIRTNDFFQFVTQSNIETAELYLKVDDKNAETSTIFEYGEKIEGIEKYQEIKVADRSWEVHFIAPENYKISTTERYSWIGYAVGNLFIWSLIFFSIKLVLNSQEEAVGIAGEKTKQLEFTELQTKAIVDNVPALVFTKDNEGRYTMMNRAFRDLLNKTEKDIIGKTDFDLFPEETARSIKENDKVVLATKKLQRFEEALDINNKKQTFVAIKIPLLNEAGEVSGISGVKTDINDIKSTEEQLKKQNEELKKLNEVMVDREMKMKELKTKLRNTDLQENETKL